MAEWLVAIGTILLAIVAAMQDRIRALFWHPQLDCKINLQPPDCHRTIMRGALRQKEISFYSFYFRFRIRNDGRISAKNVEVILTDILKKEGNSFKRIEAFSPDNLLWSTTGKVYCDYISPDTFKHCNLGHIHDPGYRDKLQGESNPLIPLENTETIFCFDLYFKSNILYYLVGPGTYRIRIKVGCENAKTIDREYLITLTGKWFEDESRMLNEGFSIEEITH